MKRFLAFFLVLAMAFTMSTAFSVSAAPRVYVSGEADVVEHIGDLTLTKVNGIWANPTSNNMILITPGQSISGLYYEKLYAKYNEELGCYEVVEKVANHRAYTQAVEKGYIGLCFNYAPLTTEGSDIAKANWYVWQHIRVGDRLYLSSNIDVDHRYIVTEGDWGTASFKSSSFISVETVRSVYDDVTPYSNKSIVAQGDSITVGGGWTSVWGDYFHTTVINSGFGGDTAHASLASRYNTYVKPFDPEIVIVSFGINDAFAAAPSEALIDKYEKALRDIYAENTKLGATTVFMNANVIKLAAIADGGVFDKGDYSSFGGEEAYLDTFVGRMKTVADDLGCVLIDLYSMWKAEGLSPENIIDSCHPTGHGYDMNWTVQKPALIENMKAICGDTIRVLDGTTVGNAVNGMPDCTVTVKNQLGNAITDTSAKLLAGFTVEYSYNGKSVGTYTVETFAPNKLLVSDTAPFMVKNGALIHTEGLTVQAIIDGVLNYSVSVKNAEGTELAATDAVSIGDTVTVTLNDSVDSPSVTLPVVHAKPLGDVNGDDNVDSLDASLVLQYDADLIDTIITVNADVNKDGRISSLDAAYILRYAAGLIKEF
ncbi:MAG: hypothetical protein IKK83_00075 [Clostridia bacterium]|nr:hypothetical protein [Clostridia bacterium]